MTGIDIPEAMKKAIDKPDGKAFYCPFCKRLTISPNTMREGVNVTMCAMCASFERHRALYFIYDKYMLDGAGEIRALHMAPEKSLYDKISAHPNVDYVCADLEPENFPFAKDVKKEDAMNLSFADGSFDFVLHNHVIEHVPDDRKLISECMRVLKKDGKCIMCFPYEPDMDSDFGPSETPEERTKRFGWHDHLRLYGRDFLDHIKDDGYDVSVVFAGGGANYSLRTTYGVCALPQRSPATS
jgi:SAM-dependent methyltransferase